MPHGDLEVYLEGALNIRNTSLLGKCSPYCILTVGEQSYKSNVVADGGSKPFWNQTFNYKIDRSTNDLKIQIKAKNAFRDDDSIGEVHLAFMEVFREGHTIGVTPYPVIRGGKQHGDIRLGLRFFAKRRPAHLEPSRGPSFQPNRRDRDPSIDGPEDDSSYDGSSRRSRFEEESNAYSETTSSPQRPRQQSHEFDHRSARRQSMPADLHPLQPPTLQHVSSAPTPAHVKQQPRPPPSAPPVHREQRRPVAKEEDAPVWPRRPQGPDPRVNPVGLPSRDGSSHGGSSHEGSGHGGSGHGRRPLQTPEYDGPQNSLPSRIPVGPALRSRAPAPNFVGGDKIPMAPTHLNTPNQVRPILPSRSPASVDYSFEDIPSLADEPSAASMSESPQIPTIPSADFYVAPVYKGQIQSAYFESIAPPVVAVPKDMPLPSRGAANVGPQISEDDKPLYVSMRHRPRGTEPGNVERGQSGSPSHGQSGRTVRDFDAGSEGSLHSRRSSMSQDPIMSKLPRPPRETPVKDLRKSDSDADSEGSRDSRRPSVSQDSSLSRMSRPSEPANFELETQSREQVANAHDAEIALPNYGNYGPQYQNNSPRPLNPNVGPRPHPPRAIQRRPNADGGFRGSAPRILSPPANMIRASGGYGVRSQSPPQGGLANSFGPQQLQPRMPRPGLRPMHKVLPYPPENPQYRPVNPYPPENPQYRPVNPYPPENPQYRPVNPYPPENPQYRPVNPYPPENPQYRPVNPIQQENLQIQARSIPNQLQSVQVPAVEFQSKEAERAARYGRNERGEPLQHALAVLEHPPKVPGFQPQSMQDFGSDTESRSSRKSRKSNVSKGSSKSCTSNASTRVGPPVPFPSGRLANQRSAPQRAPQRDPQPVLQPTFAPDEGESMEEEEDVLRGGGVALSLNVQTQNGESYGKEYVPVQQRVDTSMQQDDNSGVNYQVEASVSTSQSVSVEQTVTVERSVSVEQSVFVEQNISVERGVEVEDSYEVQLGVEVERSVGVETSYEVERSIEVEGIVEVETSYEVERSVEVEQSVEVETSYRESVEVEASYDVEQNVEVVTAYEVEALNEQDACYEVVEVEASYDVEQNVEVVTAYEVEALNEQDACYEVVEVEASYDVEQNVEVVTAYEVEALNEQDACYEVAEVEASYDVEQNVEVVTAYEVEALNEQDACYEVEASYEQNVEVEASYEEDYEVEASYQENVEVEASYEENYDAEVEVEVSYQENHEAEVSYEMNVEVEASYEENYEEAKVFYEEDIQAEVSYEETVEVETSYKESYEGEASYEENVTISYEAEHNTEVSYEEGYDVDVSYSETQNVEVSYEENVDVSYEENYGVDVNTYHEENITLTERVTYKENVTVGQEVSQAEGHGFAMGYTYSEQAGADTRDHANGGRDQIETNAQVKEDRSGGFSESSSSSESDTELHDDKKGSQQRRGFHDDPNLGTPKYIPGMQRRPQVQNPQPGYRGEGANYGAAQNDRVNNWLQDAIVEAAPPCKAMPMQAPPVRRAPPEQRPPYDYDPSYDDNLYDNNQAYYQQRPRNVAPAYDANNQAYPEQASNRGYPADNRGYPEQASNQGYPADNQGYPEQASNQGYPPLMPRGVVQASDANQPSQTLPVGSMQPGRSDAGKRAMRNLNNALRVFKNGVRNFTPIVAPIGAAIAGEVMTSLTNPNASSGGTQNGIEDLFVHVVEKAVVTAIHDGMAHHQGRGQMMQLGYANGMGGTGMHPPPPRMVYAPTSRPVMRPMPGGPTMGGAPRGPRVTGPYPGTPGGPPLGMRPRGPPMGGPRGPPMGGFPRGPPMRGPPIRGPSRGPPMGGLPQVPHPGTIRPPMPDLQTAAFIAAVQTSAAQSMLGLV